MREFPYVLFSPPPSLPGLPRQSIASQDFLEDRWIRGSSPRMTTLVGERTLPFDLRLQRILDHAIEGRRLWRSLVALFGDESVALCDQAGELFVQRVALLHLPVEFVLALLGFQRAQIFRQFVVLHRAKLLTSGRDVADQIAIAGDRFLRHPGAFVEIAG